MSTSVWEEEASVSTAMSESCAWEAWQHRASLLSPRRPTSLFSLTLCFFFKPLMFHVWLASFAKKDKHLHVGLCVEFQDLTPYRKKHPPLGFSPWFTALAGCQDAIELILLDDTVTAD